MRKYMGSILMAVVLFSLSACGKKEAEDSSSTDSGTQASGSTAGSAPDSESKVSADLAQYAGKYKLILDTTEVPEAEKAMMEEFKKDLPELIMDLKADGTADLLAKGDNLTAKWSVSGETLTVDPDKDGEPTATFKIEGEGKMLVPDETMKLEPIGKAVPKFEKQ